MEPQSTYILIQYIIIQYINQLTFSMRGRKSLQSSLTTLSAETPNNLVTYTAWRDKLH